MAIAPFFELKQGAAADVPTPDAGYLRIFLDTSDGALKVKNSAGTVAALGAVLSVFARSGAVVATSGDYSVAQVTGAAPLASPTFTGTPAAPTASPGVNTTQLATTAFVAAAIAALINSAPGALDTLEELADALGDDANFAATMTTALALKAPLASPALTGSPTAPTKTAGDNSTNLATTAYVDTAVTSGSATVADNSITNAKLRDSAALSVIGRSANSSGDPADIATSADGDVLRRDGTTLGFGTITGTSIASSAALAGSPTTTTQSAGDASTKIATTDFVATAVANGLNGLSWKQEVRAATTVAGTLASSFENGDTIDGVTLATGNRILIKNQAAPAENGIYIVAASGAPSRATDADSGAELVNATVFVSEGTTNADTAWTCTTNATITVGSTSLAFAQFGGSGAPTGSAGGSLAGTYPNPTLAASGVTAATYGSPSRAFVGTINAEGRVTAASDVAISGGVGAAVPPWVSDHPDTEPGSPNAADDEFGGTGYPSETSLDTAGTRFASATPWAWRNQGGATATLTAGVVVLVAPSGTTNLRIIEQALPAGTTWKYRAKICVYAPFGNFWQAGVTVIESGTTKFEQLVSSESGLIRVDRYSAVTTYGSTPATFASITFYQRQIYIEIERNGSNIFYRFSPTGFSNTFQLLYTSSGYWTSAPDKIGLMATSNGNGADVTLSCEWFRRIA